MRSGVGSLETKINNYRKPKSELIIEQREGTAKTYLEEMIIEMEV